MLITYPDVAAADPLTAFGELYRDDQGCAVWRIHTAKGEVVAEGIASDFDAAWIAAKQVPAPVAATLRRTP